MVQVSHMYMTSRKIVALTRWTFISKVMSLLFNMLSRFFITFSSKEQASLNFMAAVTVCSHFGAQENKVCHCFHFSPSIFHEVMGPDVILYSRTSHEKNHTACTLMCFSLFSISIVSLSFKHIVTSHNNPCLLLPHFSNIPQFVYIFIWVASNSELTGRSY